MMEALLAPLDQLRRACLLVLGGQLGAWAARRDLRVAVLGSLAITTALAGVLLAPTWMLALGPVVFGIPHVLADIRYLVARPGLHRRGIAALCVAAPLAAAAVVNRLWLGALAAAVAVVVARGTLVRRAAALACLAPLVAAAMLWRGWAELVFAHAHNAVAVAMWWAFWSRRTRLHLVPIGLFLLASAALAGGALDPLWRVTTTLLPDLGAPVRAHARDLAPRTAGDLGVRLVLFFAFAQSVHYAVWLRLVPEDDRPRPAPRTFVGSYRALVADLGRPVIVLAAAATVALLAWACVDLVAARSGYLRFAVFHGHLELAAAAWLFVEGRRATPEHGRRSSPAPRAPAKEVTSWA